MLYINRDTPTEVITQASELMGSGDYLWRLYGQETQVETLFYAQPTEINARFCAFVLDVDLVEGDYTYEIFEGISPDVDYISMPLLEAGKLVINEKQTS